MAEDEGRTILIPFTRYHGLIELHEDDPYYGRDEVWQYSGRAASWPEPDPAHDLSFTDGPHG